MSLKDQLNADLRDAMRANDDTRRSTLRMLLTAVRNAEIPPERADTNAPAAGPERLDLNDEAVLDIVRKQIKQRRDSIDVYSKAGRTDLASREEAEVVVLQVYLPPQMSREDIAEAARAVIQRIGARGPADKGKVMGPLMSELRGKAEGGEINAVVTELLTQA